jgi:hypothetical protein
MFTRLAKSGLVKFWPVQPQRIAQGLHRAELFNRSYSNDNLPGFRRPAATASAGIQPRRWPVIGSIETAGSNAAGRSPTGRRSRMPTNSSAACFRSPSRGSP